jgi:hypothetical protein
MDKRLGSFWFFAGLCFLLFAFPVLSTKSGNIESGAVRTIPTKRFGDRAGALKNYAKRSSGDATEVGLVLWAADVEIGTPPQTFSLQIDTGSPIVSIYRIMNDYTCSNT